MNAVTQPRPQIMTGGQVSALVPQSLDEAFRVATAMAASGMTPKGVDKPEQVLVAIMAGAELGFAPFQAMQSFAVINGKPNIWGDALPALLWSRGFDIEEWYDDEDAPTKAFCKITRPGGKEITRTFSVEDAKRAGLTGKQGPWQQYQKRMLQMRARAFAARDGASDVLRGMQVAEEVQDYQPMTARRVPAEGPGLAARLSAPKTEAATEGFNTVNGLDPDDNIPDFDAAASPGAVSEEPALDPDHEADAGSDFPGDTPRAGEAETAGSAEADTANDGTGSAVDAVLVWQRRLIEDMDGLSLEQLDHLLKNPSDQEMFEELEDSQPQLAMDLNKAITRRRRELG